jgi:hypothetical protein
MYGIQIKISIDADFHPRDLDLWYGETCTEAPKSETKDLSTAQLVKALKSGKYSVNFEESYSKVDCAIEHFKLFKKSKFDIEIVQTDL